MEGDERDAITNERIEELANQQGNRDGHDSSDVAVTEEWSHGLPPMQSRPGDILRGSIAQIDRPTILDSI